MNFQVKISMKMEKTERAKPATEKGRALILLSVIILAGCRTTPPGNQDFFQDEQCSPQFEIVKDEDGKEWVDVEKSVCRCRTYHIGKDYVGPVRVGGSVPVTRKHLSQCNLIKGYVPKIDSKMVNFLEWVRTEVELSSPEPQNQP